MAVFSRCSRAATAARTPNAAASAAAFSYLIRPLSHSFSSSSSCSSSTFDPEIDIGRNKSAGLGTLKREPKGRNVQWVFLGCPGVGKGTYASRLSNLVGVPHIATGDLVRDELASSGPLSSQLKEIVNQGKLVSDEIIIDLLSKRLEKGEAKGEMGFILDGFPRTVRQAEILEGVTDIDLVINLKLREEALLAKCLGRRICSECGGNYNLASIDIKAENGRPGMHMGSLPPPPECASKLITRPDDTEEVVKNRLRIYQSTTRPVEDFYRIRGKLLEFDLPGGIPESWSKLLRALNLEDHGNKHTAAA
ncbi:putative adenylate kinase 6 [Hibiscus syriacus]|uniref:adenylate kinase n=1 Tax=Hibiscus syriacus TaxID=106335 RepID=A0A6A2X399_HIBSY|nr:probable adenylate kinase 6, chloroplastic [Hibiscus syriacus]KAE8669218.1 putative adenylate kinase 6 [Hibiscus syriacus]